MNSRSYHDWEDLILKEDKEKIQKWKRVMKENKLTEERKKKTNKIKQNMYKS